ncbi:MAG: polysaccharide deacetylase family protein [Clostridiales bacterium]|jgi:polysaccharide deacetylase family sporulation protein PdaB|nr:polysaccharide deacetylase family protein [Clostridiales bacterium]
MRYLVVRKRTLKMAACALAVLILAVTLLVRSDAAAVYLGVNPRKTPIYRVQTTEKKVAISFDAAWGAERTQSLLDTLKEYGVSATFFLVGFWVRKYPEYVKKIDEAGLEIGTHSNTHPHMPRLNETQMDLELKESCASIESVTNKKPELFRAPFGDYSDKMLNVCERAGLKTIQWDIDSLDWKDLTARAMSERVLSRVKPGSIVLFHNDGKYTPDALPVILLGLKNKGYTVTHVGDLLLTGDYTIDHAGEMKAKQ